MSVTVKVADFTFTFGENFSIRKGGVAYTPRVGNTQQFAGTNADVRKRELSEGEHRSPPEGYPKDKSQYAVPEYYTACDLVTLPSLPQENSPMVFLEALAAEKRVVCTDTPRNRWILGDCGIYVNPQDIASYARALHEGLIRAGDRAQFANQANLYSWEKIINQYTDLLRTL